jgi:hypothetical protein
VAEDGDSEPLVFPVLHFADAPAQSDGQDQELQSYDLQQVIMPFLVIPLPEFSPKYLGL